MIRSRDMEERLAACPLYVLFSLANGEWMSSKARGELILLIDVQKGSMQTIQKYRTSHTDYILIS